MGSSEGPTVQTVTALLDVARPRFYRKRSFPQSPASSLHPLSALDQEPRAFGYKRLWSKDVWGEWSTWEQSWQRMIRAGYTMRALSMWTQRRALTRNKAAASYQFIFSSYRHELVMSVLRKKCYTTVEAAAWSLPPHLTGSIFLC